MTKLITWPAWVGIAGAVVSIITQSALGNWIAAMAWGVALGWAALYLALARHMNRNILPRLELLDDFERNFR